MATPETIEVWVTRDCAPWSQGVRVWSAKPDKVRGDFLRTTEAHILFMVHVDFARGAFGFTPRPGTCLKMLWTPPIPVTRTKKAKVKR